MGFEDWINNKAHSDDIKVSVSEKKLKRVNVKEEKPKRESVAKKSSKKVIVEETDSKYFKFTGRSKLTLAKFTGNMPKVVIPEYVEGKPVVAIAKGAFEDCNSLLELVMPESIATINGSAFKNCSNLKAMHISNNVAQLVSTSFEGCVSLEEVNIPDNVTDVNYRMLVDSPIKKLHLGKSVKSVTHVLFRTRDYMNRKTEKITVDKDNQNFEVKNDALLTKDGKVLITFFGNEEIYQIPDTVETIMDGAFCGCNTLKDIIIPESVTEIRNGAFENCGNLTDITLPSKLKNIANYVFYNCSKLTNVNVPDGLESIDYDTFTGCPNLVRTEKIRSLYNNLYEYMGGFNNYINRPYLMNGGTSMSYYSNSKFAADLNVKLSDGVDISVSFGNDADTLTLKVLDTSGKQIFYKDCGNYSLLCTQDESMLETDKLNEEVGRYSASRVDMQKFIDTSNVGLLISMIKSAADLEYEKAEDSFGDDYDIDDYDISVDEDEYDFDEDDYYDSEDDVDEDDEEYLEYRFKKFVARENAFFGEYCNSYNSMVEMLGKVLAEHFKQMEDLAEISYRVDVYHDKYADATIKDDLNTVRLGKLVNDNDEQSDESEIAERLRASSELQNYTPESILVLVKYLHNPDYKTGCMFKQTWQPGGKIDLEIELM